MELPLIEDFRSIVLEDRPLIDVRAPIEFEKGAFVGAKNLPLMDDKERHLIGIRYKEAGNEEAVKLGEKLVGPFKEERVAAWKKYVEENPDAYIYCFRGGQRSQISQAWLAESGITRPRLKGGYKAFRNFLMEESERIVANTETIIIGGRTGSGKTLLLPKIENSIDLEGLANHRGSTFGRNVTPQPTQINFENDMAYALIKFEAGQHKQLVIEHESHNVGHVHIPKPIYQSFEEGGLVILVTPIQERTEITFDEYVTSALQQYSEKFGEEGVARWFEDVGAGIDRIRKRLGSERHLQVQQMFKNAYVAQIQRGDASEHKTWIKILLEEYYDPMYDYQIEKTKIPILFRGNAQEILAFIKERNA